MRVCIGLAQQLEGTGSTGTVSWFFCAEIATKFEIARKQHHGVSYRHAL